MAPKVELNELICHNSNMGINPNRFTSPINDHLLCGVCSCVLHEPNLTPCGHTFCRRCIELWLERPSTTCPECRSPVTLDDTRPVISLRNYINSLEVTCIFKEIGCHHADNVESIARHETECPQAPAKCPHCDMNMTRSTVATHRSVCSARVEAADTQEVFDDELEGRFSRLSLPDEHDRSRRRHRRSETINTLSCRVTSLELQIRLLRKDLEVADAKNRRIERELKRAKEELESKRSQLLDHKYADFDPDYGYGGSDESVAPLAQLINKFLHRRPSYIDRNRVFNAVKRCYDLYITSDARVESDVHMLLATAKAASTAWFSHTQLRHIDCWLQGMLEYWRLSQVPVE